MTDSLVLERVRANQSELADLRRDIHAHPELGRQEGRTAGVVAAALRSWGVEVAEGVGGHGVVGTIRGRRPGTAAIGLRADMDALPLVEQTGLPYASTNEGVAHACGHDGHTAVLLGAARELAAAPDFAGTVHVIFQPAEEGLGGALAMLDDGLLERFPCDAVYGLHSGPGLPVGMIATGTGPLMAGAGRFDVTFTGPGSHGGLGAHLAPDLTVVSATYVLALQSIVARNVPATETAVVSVGYVEAGSPGTANVMPARVGVGGTFRYYTKGIRDLCERRIEELATAMAAAYGCQATVLVTHITPPLVNPADRAATVVRAATSALGADHVVTSMPPITASEDFAYFLEARPGAFVFLGNGAGPMVHTPRYDFDDDAIPAGVAYWVGLVTQELAGGDA